MAKLTIGIGEEFPVEEKKPRETGGGEDCAAWRDHHRHHGHHHEHGHWHALLRGYLRKRYSRSAKKDGE
jgi:hypothetical protein